MNLASPLHGERKPFISRRMVLFFRTISYLLLALAIFLIPGVGENRVIVAITLVVISVPIAVILELNYPVAEHAWSEPLLDLVTILVIVHLVPNVWFPALLLGVVLVQAPSILGHHNSHWLIAAMGLLLISGMSFAAVLHNVPDWYIAIIALLCIYPAVVFYAYWQSSRAALLRERQQTLHSMQLIAGGVAHDFNNILTSIEGQGELAMLSLQDHKLQQSEVHDAVLQMVASADRAAALSEQLLVFSGRDISHASVVSLERIARSLMTLLGAVLAKGLKVELRCEADDTDIQADLGALQHLLMNMVLSLADGAQENAGEIHLILENRWDSSLNKSVVLRIARLGVGTDAAQQKRSERGSWLSRLAGWFVVGDADLGLAGMTRVAGNMGATLRKLPEPLRDSNAPASSSYELEMPVVQKA